MSFARHIHTLFSMLRPLSYIAAGGVISYALLSALLSDFSPLYAFIGVPMLLITLFLVVVGIVHLWIKLRFRREDEVLCQYTWRQLFWLNLRCFVVVVTGITLTSVFYLMLDLLPVDIRDLVRSWSLLYYILCGFLTIFAMLSILRGEALQEIRLRAAQSENAMLKSQLNPHFLYNMLNTIDALVWLDPAKASDAISQLSSVMRYLTYSARRSEVSVAEELENIASLISLARLRMPSTEVLQLDVSEVDMQVAQSKTIAPLMLLPLIENTFKHAANATRPGGIQIVLQLSAHHLSLRTENDIRPTDATSSRTTSARGVGLQTLRRRLQLLYPGAHHFSATEVEGRWVSELILRF